MGSSSFAPSCAVCNKSSRGQPNGSIHTCDEIIEEESSNGRASPTLFQSNYNTSNFDTMKGYKPSLATLGE